MGFKSNSSLFFLYLVIFTTPSFSKGESLIEVLKKWVDPDTSPSLEVKVGPDGVSVSTGPSRSQIYWTIALWVGGAFLFLIFLVLLCTLIYHIVVTRPRRRDQGFGLWNTTSNNCNGRRVFNEIEVPGNFMVLNPTLGTPRQGVGVPPIPPTRPWMNINNKSSNSTGNDNKSFVNVGHGVWTRQ